MYNDQQPNPSSWQEEEQRMTPPPKRGNAFSSASMTAGTFSVLSGQRTFFPGRSARHFIRSALRKGDKMDSQARLGCILSSIGLCLGIVIFIYAAVTVYQNFPELLQQYQQLYKMYQGGM